MNLFQKIFAKFGNRSTEKISESTSAPANDVSDQYICGITFVLNKNHDMEIVCMIPKDLDKLDTYEVAELAEKYAELLLYINKGLFKHDIDSILNKTSSLDSENKILFTQNVSNFYEMHNIEFSKLMKNNRPLISPSSVFRT